MLSLFSSESSADTAALDPTFGTDGTVILTPPPNEPGGYFRGLVSTGSDGNIVIVGSDTSTRSSGYDTKVRLTRLNPDGSFDASFSEDGQRVWRFARKGVDSGSIAHSVSVLDDGRIQIEGLFSDHYVAKRVNFTSRFLVNGEPDLSYGANGSTRRSHYSDFADGGFGIDTQPDGAVDRCRTYPPTPTLFTRDLPDGGPDTSFSRNGRSKIDITASGWNIGFLTACGRTKSGKLVASYDATNAYDERAEIVIRLTASGHLDHRFGVDGMVVVPMPIMVSDTIVLDDGGVTFSGAECPVPGYYPCPLAVYKLRRSGAPDLTYGYGDAIAQSSLLAPWPIGKWHVTEDPYGAVVLGGAFGSQPTIISFTASGEIDQGFGDCGSIVGYLPSTSAVYDITTDSAGRVIATTLGDGVGDALAVSRFNISSAVAGPDRPCR